MNYCTKAIELNPDFAEAYDSRAEGYVMLGQYDKAVSDYKKSIEKGLVSKSQYDKLKAACIKSGKIEMVNECDQWIANN